MSIHFLIVLWAEDEFEAIIQVHLGFFSSMKEEYTKVGTTTIILILFGMESWCRSNESGDS